MIDDRSEQDPVLFRNVVLIFSFVLACLSLWTLAPEVARSSLVSIANQGDGATTKREQVALAASLAVVRGDLLAEDALAHFDPREGDKSDAAATDEARGPARRALKYAPHDARVWLLLASIDSRFDWLNKRTAACLRMSFYTGANEVELIPMRLILATQSSALEDQDFQQLVRHDINLIITHRPDMLSAIVNAYREAPPVGRRFIEDTLNEADPSLLQKLGIKS